MNVRAHSHDFERKQMRAIECTHTLNRTPLTKERKSGEKEIKKGSIINKEAKEQSNKLSTTETRGTTGERERADENSNGYINAVRKRAASAVCINKYILPTILTPNHTRAEKLMEFLCGVWKLALKRQIQKFKSSSND